MSIVGAKRLQQGVFEALASQNRAAGSGGGSGFQVLAGPASVHGGNAIGNPGKSYAVSSYTLVRDGSGVNCQVTVPANRLSPFFLFGDVVIQGPSAGGQLVNFEIFLDGSNPADSMFPAVGALTNTNNCYTVPIMYVATLQPGSHTFDVRINTGGATYEVFSFDLYCFQLGF